MKLSVLAVPIKIVVSLVGAHLLGSGGVALGTVPSVGFYFMGLMMNLTRRLGRSPGAQFWGGPGQDSGGSPGCRATGLAHSGGRRAGSGSDRVRRRG